MKNKNIYLGILAVLLLVVGASATVSAQALGDGYAMGGYQIGWWLIGIAVLIFVLTMGAVGVLNKKKWTTPAIALVIIGALLLIPFSGPTTTVDPATEAAAIAAARAATFDLTHTGGFNATYNEDTNILTIPVDINASDEVSVVTQSINTSIEIIPPIGGATTDLATLYYETDYLMRFEGEYLLEESGDYYMAVFNNSAGAENKYYNGQLTMQMTDTGAWVNLTYTFDSGASTWAAEVASGDLYSTIAAWNIRFSNGRGWSETVTVQLVIANYE